MAKQFISADQLASIADNMGRVEEALVELRDAMETPQAVGWQGWLDIDCKTTQFWSEAERLMRAVADCGVEVAPCCYYHGIEYGKIDPVQ